MIVLNFFIAEKLTFDLGFESYSIPNTSMKRFGLANARRVYLGKWLFEQSWSNYYLVLKSKQCNIIKTNATCVFRFSYVYPKSSRYILILDRSQSMLNNDRWTLLHKTLHHFISAIPEGSEVSVVTFTQTAVMNLSPTVVTEWNR